MTRFKHRWISTQTEPPSIFQLLNGPELRWQARCPKCGARKGTKRAPPEERRPGFTTITWDEVYRTSDGQVVTSRPACVPKGVNNA